MATASTTDSNVVHSTSEQENYLRICRLLKRTGTVLMREVFDSFYPPSSLANKLSDPATKNLLMKTLIKPQRDLVYPASGVCGESKDFDISLLSKLLKTICNLPPLPTGWDHLPKSSDVNLTADIVRIKVYRNDISHKHLNMEISDAEFCSLWNEIKMALLRIADYTTGRGKWEEVVEDLRNDPLTPEAEKDAMELHECYLKDMDVKECTEKGFHSLATELKVSSQRSEEGIARVERQMGSVQDSVEEDSQRLSGGINQLQQEFERMQNQFQQLREEINRRDSSSGESGANLPIGIEPESMTGPRPQEGARAASGDIPTGPAANSTHSLTQTIPTEQQVMNVITLGMFQNLNPSTNEEINGFVHHIEAVKRALIVDIKKGSLVLTVKCSSLEVLEGLWEDYCSGHLREVAQNFLVTEKVLEDLGLVELNLKTVISEEDYRACHKHLMKCADSAYSDVKGGKQKEEAGREKECRTFERPGGVPTRDMSELRQPIPHFVNRNSELTAIKNHLSPDAENHCRCVLLHGAVGMGKTATAIKAANEMLDTNSNTVVVYVNCRYATSLDDLAMKIATQLYHFPLNEPAAEMKRLLINEEEFVTILLLDNFEFLLHLNDGGHSKRINPNETSEILEFFEDIVTESTKVYLLVTSSEEVHFPHTGQEQIRLLPLNEDDSFHLMKNLYGDTPLEKETAYKIAHFCGGIPLVLSSLASWKDKPSDLLEMLTKADPKETFELFARIPTAPEDKKIEVCLDACFNRLNAQQQNALVSLALFRGDFTMSRAVEVFKSGELRGQISELAQRSFLEQHTQHKPCRFSLLTVISLYCQNKAMEARFHEVFSDARKLFINYFLTFLENTFQSFISTGVSKAIIAYRREDENIMQLIDLFGESGAMDEYQEQRCIDVFNEVGELLAKMVGKKTFDRAFTLLKTKCAKKTEQKRLSECLTSLGIKELFSCCCSPDLCDVAATRAKMHLTEADRMQSSLGISTGNSRAQCLAKLGRCLVKEGKFAEGKEKIQQAIDIRKAHEYDDTVMLGATYNDLAVALSLEGEHQKAIDVREEQTLPIYREHLGDHPFTATILNNLSNNYCSLGKYDIAKQYSEEALKIRRELLKEHYDTAKSLLDLGKVLKKKEEFEEAKLCLGECQGMKRVFDDNTTIMDLERSLKELDDDVRNLGATVK